MALPPLSGSSIPDLNVNNVPNEVPKTQRDLLANMPMAMSTELTRIATDVGSYPQTALLIAGFMRGMTVKVTYYAQKSQGSSNDRTAMTDYPAERDVDTTEYIRILNFEMKLKEGVQFSSDPLKSSTEITYQALFYPGTNPNAGDRILYEFGPSQVAVFTVTSVERLSPYQDSAWAVSFSAQSFVDPSDMAALNGSTKEDMVFSKGRNHGVPYSILTTESYTLLQFITAFRKELIAYYFDTFFDETINSFLRPDGVYDPTCVRFMVNKISILETGRRCAVLYRDIDKLYNQSVWGRLASRYVANMNNMTSGYFLTTANFDGFAAFFNELYNKLVILPRPYNPASYTGKDTSNNGMAGYFTWLNYTPVIIGPTGWIDRAASALEQSETINPDQPAYYAFSKAFWTNDAANMTDTEAYLMDMILNRTISQDDPSVLQSYLQGVYAMNDMTQYYAIPVMIHMIDMLKRIIPDTVNTRNI